MEKEAKQAINEVFVTPYGSVRQDDTRGCFILQFENVKTELSLPCFFCLKKMVDAIDLDKKIWGTDDNPATEIIAPHGCSRCFVLNVAQIYYFKELLAGAKVMLDLNSIIHERLFSNGSN